MKYNEPKITSTYEAVVVGLVLAVTAPTDAKSKDALRITEGLMAQLTPRQIAKAKKEAELILAYDRKWNDGSLDASRG
jgi:hypothetical protein